MGSPGRYDANYSSFVRPGSLECIRYARQNADHALRLRSAHLPDDSEPNEGEPHVSYLIFRCNSLRTGAIQFHLADLVLRSLVSIDDVY